MMDFVPVGIVHSRIKEGTEMPMQGVAGEIEIYPAYREALGGIKASSHLILLCWMHKGRRDLLAARARKVSPDLPLKGIFALRSPSRPNPISFSVIRLKNMRDEGILEVEFLDLIDGTPVLDIKPYQPGWDAVFSATTPDRSKKIRKMGLSRYRESLVREALNYHGEWCSGAATAVRVAEKATSLGGGDLRRPGISLDPGTNACLVDALIGITGARPGNGRLHSSCPGARNRVTFWIPGKVLTFTIEPLDLAPDAILEAEEERLFSVECRDSGAWIRA